MKDSDSDFVFAAKMVGAFLLMVMVVPTVVVTGMLLAHAVALRLAGALFP